MRLLCNWKNAQFRRKSRPIIVICIFMDHTPTNADSSQSVNTDIIPFLSFAAVVSAGRLRIWEGLVDSPWDASVLSGGLKEAEQNTEQLTHQDN